MEIKDFQTDIGVALRIYRDLVNAIGDNDEIKDEQKFYYLSEWGHALAIVINDINEQEIKGPYPVLNKLIKLIDDSSIPYKLSTELFNFNNTTKH